MVIFLAKRCCNNVLVPTFLPRGEFEDERLKN